MSGENLFLLKSGSLNYWCFHNIRFVISEAKPGQDRRRRNRVSPWESADYGRSVDDRGSADHGRSAESRDSSIGIGSSSSWKQEIT